MRRFACVDYVVYRLALTCQLLCCSSDGLFIRSKPTAWACRRTWRNDGWAWPADAEQVAGRCVGRDDGNFADIDAEADEGGGLRHETALPNASRRCLVGFCSLSA